MSNAGNDIKSITGLNPVMGVMASGASLLACVQDMARSLGVFLSEKVYLIPDNLHAKRLDR